MKFVALVSFVSYGALIIATALIVLPAQGVLAGANDYYIKVGNDCIQARDNSQQVIIDNSSNATIISNSRNIQSENCG